MQDGKIIVDILRHGQPQGGDVIRGRIDHPLSEEGWQQMFKAAGARDVTETVTTRLEDPPWTEIVSSPLQRCRQFAERLNDQHELPLQVQDQWQEIDYGVWDGLPINEWREKAADQFRAFRKDISCLSPPGGENFVVFRDRILKAWDEITNKPDGSHVLLVTHGGVMRVVLPTVLNIPLNRTNSLKIPYACLSRIEIFRKAGKSSAAMVFHNCTIGS